MPHRSEPPIGFGDRALIFWIDHQSQGARIGATGHFAAATGDLQSLLASLALPLATARVVRARCVVFFAFERGRTWSSIY